MFLIVTCCWIQFLDLEAQAVEATIIDKKPKGNHPPHNNKANATSWIEPARTGSIQSSSVNGVLANSHLGSEHQGSTRAAAAGLNVRNTHCTNAPSSDLCPYNRLLIVIDPAREC